MSSLVFDAHASTVPCFYHSDALDDPLGEALNTPESSLIDPTNFPANDMKAQLAIQKWNSEPHFARPAVPGTCSVSPPGFVCGPLPAPPGTVVKCVPRMDHSDLNQLAARVLPLTTSRSNSVLDNPSFPDPRYKFFPSMFPPAISRCCGGNLVNPLDVVPPPCDASNGMYQKILPDIRAHEVDPIKMGFSKNTTQINQMAVTAKSKNVEDTSVTDRLHAWESEARRLPNNSLLERIRMMTMDPKLAFNPTASLSRNKLIKEFI